VIWYHKRGIFHSQPWQTGPELIEERYTFLDALMCGGLLCTLLQNADRVRIACLAQLVNVIALILTEPGGRSVRQAIYYPFQHVSIYGRGTVREPRVLCPEFHTIKYGDVPQLQVAPVDDPERKSLNVFVLNCGENPLTTELVFRGYEKNKPVAHEIITGDDLNAVNSFEKPHQVDLSNAEILPEGQDGFFQTELPGNSLNRVQFVPA
jgi:alpha-N-arabinofuranosidase